MKKLEEKDLNQVTDNIVIAYLNEIGVFPLLSMEEEKELAVRIQNGDQQARDKMIKCNLKIVVSIAKNYLNKGLSILDLIQEGNVGLMMAIDKYDVTKGYKFSTYASYWIKKAITRSIADKGRNVRIPVYLHDKISMYVHVILELEKKLNREPTLMEVSEEMGLPVEEVEKIYELQNDTVSINILVGDNKDMELLNLIPSDNDSLEEIFFKKALQYHVRNLIDNCNLKEKEKDILILKYGLNDNEPMTIKEISILYHLTYERVRQLEAQALMKIRKSRNIKSLAIFTQYPNQSLKNIDEYRKLYFELQTAYINKIDNYSKKDKRKVRKL